MKCLTFPVPILSKANCFSTDGLPEVLTKDNDTAKYIKMYHSIKATIHLAICINHSAFLGNAAMRSLLKSDR